MHPIALPDRITPVRLNELLRPLGIDQSPSSISFAPSHSEQQIKRRYQIKEKNENSPDDDLEFDCHENRENNEKELFQRISNLQQPLTKKWKKDEQIGQSMSVYPPLKIQQTNEFECIIID